VRHTDKQLCLAADTTEELVVVLEAMSDGGKRHVGAATSDTR
jgi:hypothetical protein